MPRPRLFRDPVHIQIRFERVNLDEPAPARSVLHQFAWIAQKIIETRTYQRLRFIRQTALANLVYHGAEHSRFTHCLGVAHLAEIMYQKILRNMSIEQNEEEHLATIVAALLHDIGHGPFSHTLEEILTKEHFDHEKMTLRYIKDSESEVHQILKSADSALPAKVATFFDVSKRTEDHWTYKIVSSQLDADRIDYLQRDALFAGLKGPAFDVERILDLLMLRKNSIALNNRAIEAAESYLVMLDVMYRAVYYHHTVRAGQSMLSTLFRRAVFLYNNGDHDVFPSPPAGENLIRRLVDKGQMVSLDLFSLLSEYHFWFLIDSWRYHADEVMKLLSTGILNRNLFVSCDAGQTHASYQSLAARAREMAAKLYRNFANDAKDYFVVLDGPARTSYKMYDWKPASQANSIWLVDDSGDGNPIEDYKESRLVDGLKQTRYFERLIVPAEVRDCLFEHRIPDRSSVKKSGKRRKAKRR
jgi:uncharacterized protein